MLSLNTDVSSQTFRYSAQRKISIFVSVFFILAIFDGRNSNASECKFHQQVDGGSDIGYQNRGRYCEGIFRQNFNFDSTISILAYFARPISFPNGIANEIEVRRHTPPSDEIEVYISSLVPQKHYQLDASVPKNVKGFRWKLDVIRDTRVNLGKQELAALGCAPSCDARHRVLVPLTLSPVSDQKKEPIPYLIVKFPLETESVQIRFLDLNDAEIAPRKTLKRPKFRPDRPRSIRLPKAAITHDKFTVDMLAFQNDGVPIPLREILLGVFGDE